MPDRHIDERAPRWARWAALAVASACAVAGCKAATSGPLSTSLQEHGMAQELPRADPPDADAATPAHLTVTLDVAATRFDVGGRQVWGESYDGTFVAPTLQFAPGGDVTVTLVNHLTVATNLHFHGLHVSPAGDADDPFVCVAPGQRFDYHLALPVDHPVGTFWYHSHAMATACPNPGMAGMGTGRGDVEEQVFAGLSGALLVGDDRALLPGALAHVTAHTLVRAPPVRGSAPSPTGLGVEAAREEVGSEVFVVAAGGEQVPDDDATPPALSARYRPGIPPGLRKSPMARRHQSWVGILNGALAPNARLGVCPWVVSGIRAALALYGHLARRRERLREDGRSKL